ncbi:MAG: type IV pili methyl-accepting chemotaxis transducer N-terminal domain-containing protein [Gammaproteobacteria bacterium]|nr:type IV pili methyl-accepting chemotaxis transducer N-terminal domain-containing protein [Gammaproteobacteria bacterium]
MAAGTGTASGLSKLELGLLGVVVGTLIAAFALFFYAGSERAKVQKHLEIVANESLTSQRLSTQAIEAASGKVGSFKRLELLRNEFITNIKQLQQGDLELGVAPVPEAVINEFKSVETIWSSYQSDINVILDGLEPISKVSEYVVIINEFIPQLLAFSDEVVGILVRKNADPHQIYIASRQLMLTQRIENNLNLVLAGGEGATTAADRFGRDATLFGSVLEGMLKGFPGLNIKKVRDGEVRSKLREVAMLFTSVSDHVDAILELSPVLFEVKDASSRMELSSAALLAATQKLDLRLQAETEQLKYIDFAVIFFGIIALLAFLYFGWINVSNAKEREELALEQNRRNQRAILRLLDEMANLAEGDLTVHATVTEEITGAIADSVNYAIDALRSLVTTINVTAVQVSSSAEKTQSTAGRLADASSHQAREIASASAAITDMADSMDGVSGEASQSAEVARKSVDIAQQGATLVRNSITGMDSIREQIQETSKRIKRLGESSQEIGDIVGLITEIADQTNILALNAAIQASTAGDAGRGFAVVADEVQRLAERSSNATKQIEALVKTIQADTNEAVHSMEQSTSGVVSGGKMAEDAGEALTRIEDVSTELASLIQGISDSASQQATVATDVSNTMNVIQEITVQTSEGSAETSTSIGNLSDMANELRKSVAGFKLPDSGDQVETVILNS